PAANCQPFPPRDEHRGGVETGGGERHGEQSRKMSRAEGKSEAAEDGDDRQPADPEAELQRTSAEGELHLSVADSPCRRRFRFSPSRQDAPPPGCNDGNLGFSPRTLARRIVCVAAGSVSARRSRRRRSGPRSPPSPPSGTRSGAQRERRENHSTI